MEPPAKYQLTFDDLPPRSRNADPQTSHRAEAELRHSGTLGKQHHETLDVLRANPGATTWELADGDPWLERRYSRRLPDLVLKGLARKGDARTCKVGGRECTTWWPSAARAS